MFVARKMLLRLVEVVAPAAVAKKVVARSNGRVCIVLLGWGGSKSRHLKRVIEWYELSPQVGSIVSFSMPLWAPQFIRKILIENLRVMIDNDARILCHAFSNNGTWVFGELGLELDKNGAQIERVVIDSAPFFKYSAMSLREAVANYQPVLLSTLLNKDLYHHPVYTPVLKVVLYTFGVGIKILYKIPILGPALVPDLVSLSVYLRDKTSTHTLFVYGREDKLIPPSEVEDFADILEKRGVSVERYVFEHAKHVSGFYDKASSEEYKKLLSAFFKL